MYPFGMEAHRLGSLTQASDRLAHLWHSVMMQSETFNGPQLFAASGIHTGSPLCPRHHSIILTPTDRIPERLL